MNYQLGDFGASGSADFIKGREFLWYFHWYNKEVMKFASYPYKTVDELVAFYDNRYKGQVEGLGKTLRIGEVSADEMKKAAEVMAKAGKGRVPSRTTYFADALIDVTRVTWYQAVPVAIKETAQVVGRGVLAAGESVNTTAWLMTKLLPIAAVLAVGMVLWRLSGTSGKDLIDAAKSMRSK